MITRAEVLEQDNILFEILSWLPAKDLAICTCVCKQWNALIKERSFLRKHMERSPEECDDCSEAPDGDGADVIVQYCSTGGLLLKKRKRNPDNKYYIENKITRKVFDVPDPPHNVDPSLFLSASDFKLVFFYQERKDESMTRECFGFLTVGKDSPWRTLEVPNAEKHGQVLRTSIRQVPDAVHYVLTINSDGESKPCLYVYSLNLESERLVVNTLPEGFSRDPFKVSAFWWDSWLALRDELNVILLLDHRKGEWSPKKTKFSLKSLKENPEFKEKEIEIVVFCARYDLLVIGCPDKYYLYNIGTGKIWKWRKRSDFYYRPSLINFEGMRRRQD